MFQCMFAKMECSRIMEIPLEFYRGTLMNFEN